MKRAGLAGILLFTFVLLAPGLVLAEQHEVEAIESGLRQYEARFNAGDAEAVAELFSEDVVYYDALGQVHEGREAVRRLYQDNFAAGFSDMTIDIIEIEVFGDVAYDIARYTISDPAGEPLVGYHLAFLVKEEGEWIAKRTLAM